MSQSNRDLRIQELRRRVRDAVDDGRFEVAIALCDQAVERAEDLGDRELRDLAICNRGGILVVQGRGRGVVGELRKVLLRSASSANSCQAAYSISQYHELEGERDRSLFYARLALDHAVRSQIAEHMAKAHNRIANLLMLDSYFQDACVHYRWALDLLPRGHDLDHALLLSNSGYCQAVLGELNHGLKQLFESLHVIRRKCAIAWERFPCLGLSYAYLELGRLQQAKVYAGRALRQAELTTSSEQIKNALYLLGEAAKLSGDDSTAYEYFARLQTEFYPGDAFISDFLMATDIRKLINLMA